MVYIIVAIDSKVKSFWRHHGRHGVRHSFHDMSSVAKLKTIGRQMAYHWYAVVFQNEKYTVDDYYFSREESMILIISSKYNSGIYT